MASLIDPLLPITGTPTTQSVRDNFQAAKTEIEQLQEDLINIALTPGPQGPEGPTGATGADGQPGAPGGANAITVNTTVTVKTSGGDFISVNAAIFWAGQQIIAPGITLTIEVWSGTFSESTLSPDLPPSVKIKAKNTYQVNLTSIQSSSGSAGNWSYIVNIASAANIEVGDIVNMQATGSGTNWRALAGAHAVTAVDIPNNRITINVKTNGSAASGSLTGYVVVYKSILSFAGVSAIVMGPSQRGHFEGIAFKGDGTTGTTGCYINGGDLALNDPIAYSPLASCAFMNFGQGSCNGQQNGGILLQGTAKLFAPYVAVSGCTAGIVASGNSSANIWYCSLSCLATTGNGYATALYTELDSSVQAILGLIANGGGAGTQNAACFARNRACLSLYLANIYGGASIGGVYASSSSFVSAYGISGTVGGTLISPAAGSPGNGNAYIDQTA